MHTQFTTAVVILCAAGAVGCAGSQLEAPAAVPDEVRESVVETAARYPVTWTLQARTGAQGGNRSVATLGDPDDWDRIDGRSDAALDMAAPVSMDDDATVFADSPPIPEGSAFVVEAIDVFAVAAGDGNGNGSVDVRVGPGSLVRLQEDPRALLQWFEGCAVIRTGRGGDISVRLANSSAVDVRLHGHIAPLESLQDLFERPFAPGQAPQSVARAGDGAAPTHGLLLGAPRAWIQLRAGAGGGNPNRVDLTGKKSNYVRELRAEPLSMASLPDMREPSTAYIDGGLIPRGKVFVITRVEYAGSARGDSNGPGEMIVSIGGTKIVDVRDHDEPIRGTWNGRIEIESGQEGQVFVEIANSSTADVRIHGAFADAPSDRP